MPKKSSGDAPKRKVTVRDIAKEVGVSHVTVSLALRNNPRISEATRKRVQQKAIELGYHPDPMLSALSNYRLSNKTKSLQAELVWLNPLQHPERLRQLEEFDLYWKGASETALQLGFQLEEFTTQELSLQRLHSIFQARGIRGIIISPVTWETTDIDWNHFPWEEYAIVRLGRSREGPLSHFITSSQVSNAILAFEQARKKGYQRVGFIGNIQRRRMFSAGYLWHQHAQPSGAILKPLLATLNELQGSKEIIQRWLDENQPDAILTDYAPLPSLLTSLGYSIPKDIGIATMSIHDTPIDAGINQNPYEIGRAAALSLASLLTAQQLGIPTIRNTTLVEGTWVDGSMLPDRTSPRTGPTSD